MSVFQNKNRSVSNFKTSGDNRNIRQSTKSTKAPVSGAVSWVNCNLSEDYENINSTIKQADQVNFIHVCKYYGIEIDAYNRKIQCPFKFHNDSDPSFNYYSETNTFHCFGCINTGGPVIFVSLLEGISRFDAATKLLKNFESNEISTLSFAKSKEAEGLYLRFSSIIRVFIQNNNTIEDLIFIDNITKSFDRVIFAFNGKRNIDIDGIVQVIDKLKRRIDNYLFLKE